MSTTRAAFALIVIGGFSGCGINGTIDVYTCEDPCGNGRPGWTCDEPCAACAGECVPLAPIGFAGPALLWIGHEALAPPCPARAPVNAYQGYADLDDVNACPACRCSDPACVLPDGLRATDSFMCQGPDFASFDAPEGWDGTCIGHAVIPPDRLSSIQIPAPTVTGCVPGTAPDVEPRNLTSPWRTLARACMGEPTRNACDDPGKTCVPAAEPAPPEFVQCIMYLRDGDTECPDDYPDKHAFYDGADDTRGCAPCECGPPEGSECAASISVYQDASCNTWSGTELSTLDGPRCVGGPSMQLGGVTAAWRTNEPGSCKASGGEPLGSITPFGLSIFCCQPPPSDDVPR